jgi:hypothetical protein
VPLFAAPHLGVHANCFVKLSTGIETQFTTQEIRSAVNETQVIVNDTQSAVNEAHVTINETQVTVNETQSKVNETQITVNALRDHVNKLVASQVPQDSHGCLVPATPNA